MVYDKLTENMLEDKLIRNNMCFKTLVRCIWALVVKNNPTSYTSEEVTNADLYIQTFETEVEILRQSGIQI